MPSGEPPKGQRFSHVYLNTGEMLPDSKRMRRRIAHLVVSTCGREFRFQLAAGLGIAITSDLDDNPHHWPNRWPDFFFEKMELRDVLDAITVAYRMLSAKGEVTRRFLGSVREIFHEEHVRYRVDDEGGVHFAVDTEFERARIATIQALSEARYAGVIKLFEDAFAALDAQPRWSLPSTSSRKALCTCAGSGRLTEARRDRDRQRRPKCVSIHTMRSRDVIAALERDRWYEVARKGSHVQFKHPVKPGRTTVPHPHRDIPIGTLKSIEKQSGVRLRT